MAAMMSEARPIGTWRSVRKSSAFEPVRRMPTTAADASSAFVSRSTLLPRCHATSPSIRPPAIRKRLPAAKNGGIVSEASSIPR
jgi:hypothetical protein